MRIININYSIVTYCLTPLIKFKQSLSIFSILRKKLWEILCTAERHLRNSSHVVQFYILYSSLKLNDAAVKASMKPENVAINIMLVRKLYRDSQELKIVFAVKLWAVWSFPQLHIRSCDPLCPSSPTTIHLLPVSLHTLLGVGTH